jgi:hypothetical protein
MGLQKICEKRETNGASATTALNQCRQKFQAAVQRGRTQTQAGIPLSEKTEPGLRMPRNVEFVGHSAVQSCTD